MCVCVSVCVCVCVSVKTVTAQLCLPVFFPFLSLFFNEKRGRLSVRLILDNFGPFSSQSSSSSAIVRPCPAPFLLNFLNRPPSGETNNFVDDEITGQLKHEDSNFSVLINPLKN